MTRARKTASAALAVSVAGAIALLTGLGGGDGDRGPSADPKPARATGSEIVLTPAAIDRRAARRSQRERSTSGGNVVELRGAGAPQRFASDTDAISPGAPSDTEVRSELRQARADLRRFKSYLGTSDAYLQTGPRARVLGDGTAVAPRDAPAAVKRVIQAGNAISKLPYKWGGGHGAWRDNGYDCSGSVSFALAGAGLLDRPLSSGLFERFGGEGPGEWITIYANGGHVFMVVAGLRFDTSGRGRDGTRWQQAGRPTGGFAVRHPRGL